MQRPTAFSENQAKDRLLVRWNWVHTMGKHLTIDRTEVTEVHRCIKYLLEAALEVKKTKRLLNQNSRISRDFMLVHVVNCKT